MEKELSRYKKLRIWMAERFITDEAVGEKLGMTGSGINRMLKSEAIIQEKHQKLINLGFPENLLPEALSDPSRKRQPRMRPAPKFPGLDGQN